MKILESRDNEGGVILTLDVGAGKPVRVAVATVNGTPAIWGIQRIGTKYPMRRSKTADDVWSAVYELVRSLAK